MVSHELLRYCEVLLNVVHRWVLMSVSTVITLSGVIFFEIGGSCVCRPVCVLCVQGCHLCRTVFNTPPDTHIESLERAESHVVEGTSKWSCKIKVSGKLTVMLIVLICIDMYPLVCRPCDAPYMILSWALGKYGKV